MQRQLIWAAGAGVVIVIALFAVARFFDRTPGIRLGESAPKIALALSGGGYRATLHGLAALRALHELGRLEDVEIVSVVSGGSIAGAFYVYHRERYGDDFSFDRFENELLTAVSEVEVPRTVLATEVLTTGAEATKTLIDCGKAEFRRFFGGGNSFLDWVKAPNRFRDLLVECAGKINLTIKETVSLRRAIKDFAGAGCEPGGGDVVARVASCAARPAASLGTSLTSMLLTGALGADVENEMQRTFCSLREELCLTEGRSWHDRPPVSRPESGHPFAELLNIALFKPWLEDQGAVRVSSLSRGPTLLVNASFNSDGDLWTATQSGSGSRSPREGSPSTGWRESDTGDGPGLADAVAASTCHPLFCSPIEVPWLTDTGSGKETLIDGGVYDNLGVEAVLTHLAASGARPDLLLIADARRPFTDVEANPSRVGTILRSQDMLILQKSEATLEKVRTQWKGRCGLVYVSLADSGSPATSLGRLPTDLRPVQDAREKLLQAVAAFHGAMAANPCISAPRTKEAT